MKVYKINQAPEGAEYVGRGSLYGNPFVIGKDGDRAEVIEKFKAHAEAILKDKPDWLEPLRGKDLVCFCAPLPCHADVIIELLGAL